jgi:RND family efflux transporter MFP subunit
VLGVAAVVIVAGLMIERGSGQRAPKGSGAAGVGHQQPIPLVGVGHPKFLELPHTLQLTANITSLTQSAVAARTAGYLLAVTVRPGDRVQAGQVVALVDHGQLDAQVAQAQAAVTAAETGVDTAEATLAAARAQRLTAMAALSSARATLRKSQAQLVDAKATYARTAELAKEGALAQQALDDAKTVVDSDQADVDASAALVDQAVQQVEAAGEQIAAAASQVRTQRAQVANQQAALRNAQIGLEYATIVSPFNGIVVSRSLDPGAYVAPGTTSNTIITIADLDHLDVLVYVTEPDLPSLHTGDPIRIAVDSYPGRVFRGVVSRIAGGVDPVTRTAQVEIDIPNPGHLLRPGMYATVNLSAGTTRALVVPLSALVSAGTQHFVWAVVDNKTTQRPVTVGRSTGDVIEITGGVTAQDLIVVRGTDLVREGQLIKGVSIGL